MPTTHNMADYVSLTVSGDDGTTLPWTSVGSSTPNLNVVDQNDDGNLDIGSDTTGGLYLYAGYTVTVGANTYGVFKFNTTYLIPYNSAVEDLLTVFPASGSTTAIADNAVLANCFLTGTRIATPDGEVAVETMTTGDMVLAADGRAVPVHFLFRQNVVNTPWIYTRMELVRIAAGALSNSLPDTDLTVSADHGMILDGMVINASALVNGSTIRFVPLSELPEIFTYWHI